MKERQQILIGHGNAEAADRIAAILRTAGADVIVTLDASEARGAMLRNRVAFAVIEASARGYELARQLRGIDECSGLPVIFVGSPPLDGQTIFDHGSDGIDYLNEPWPPALLSNKARILLELDRHRWRTDEMVRLRGDKIKHLNAVLRGIRNVNQLIVREKDPARLIREICQSLVEARGFVGAWIVRTDENLAVLDTAAAGHRGRADEFAERLRQRELPACCEAALRNERGLDIVKPLADCSDCEMAAVYGVSEAMSAVLRHQGRCYGFMGVALPEEIPAGVEEQSLLLEVAGDVAYALHGIEQEQRIGQAVEELRASETRFRLAAGVVSDLVYEWDLDSDRLEWYGDIDQALGYDPGCFPRTIGAWLARTHPDDRGRMEEAVAQHRRSAAVIRYEYRIQRQDGEWLYWEDQAAAVVDEAGRPRRWMGACTDITGRKRAEEALRQSEEHYRRLFETMAQGVVYQSANGRIVSANPAAERMLGLSLDQMLGRTSMDPRWRTVREDGSEMPGHEHPSMIALRTGRYAHSVMGVFHPCEDRYVWIDVKAIPLFRPNERQPYQVYATFSDITERRESDLQIKRLNQDLERRVEERTAQLEATNAELEAFAYSVSHDLRAPLRRILGFSQILLADYGANFDERGRHYLERVCAGARQMGDLIDGLLRLSRITGSEIRYEQVNLSALAVHIVKALRDAEPNRRVEFIQPEGVVARGDAKLLGIALENLLGNAWKFTSKLVRPARIEFGVARNSECGSRNAALPGETTVYFVRDNGAGFDMAHAGKLFGAFQRLHQTGEFEGSGIGLATVQRIVHKHGGQVWAEGAVDEGATLYFTLPD